MDTNTKSKNRSDYCWNNIGTWADDAPSCPALKELVHCRNCDVFHAGAKTLLESPAPEGYLNEWTEELSSEKEQHVKLSEPVFVFRLEQEWLALPAHSVRNISRPVPIHRVPGKSDDTLLGLANIKGDIELCFSMKALIGVELHPGANGNGSGIFGERFVAIGTNEENWVFAADEILDICRYRIDEDPGLPATVANSRPCYISSVFRYKNFTVGMLDEELITDTLKRRIS